MKKKLITTMLVLAMIATVFSGCGKNTVNNTGTKNTATSTPAGTDTSTANDTAGSTDSSTGTTDTTGDTTGDATDTANAEKTGGTLVVGQLAEPITLNPDGTNDNGNLFIINNVFNKLMKINNESEILPDLAQSYEISEDGLTYTFHLYENVYFHDGVLMTSDDVLFTFDQIVAQGGRAAEKFNTNVVSITAPDANTVVFQLETPDASFLSKVAYDGCMILPRHIYEGKDFLSADALLDPVGTGPFVWSDWTKGSSITLVKNENYFMGPDVPYLDKVQFTFISDGDTAVQAFLNGEIDVLGGITPTDTSVIYSNPEVAKDVVMYASRFCLAFNMNQAPFDNLEVRKGFAYAMDGDELISKAIKEQGLRTTTYISPLFNWAVNNDADAATLAFDQAKAVECFENAGLTKDADGFYMNVTLDTFNYAPFTDLALVFQYEMAQVGINVTINMLEWAAWDEKVNQNHDFEITMTSAYQGPDVSALSASVVTGQYNNFFGYSNSEVDQLMADALTAKTMEEQAVMYKRVQQILAADIPYVPFSEWVGYFTYKAYLSGMPSSPDNVDICSNGEYTYVYFNEK